MIPTRRLLPLLILPLTGLPGLAAAQGPRAIRFRSVAGDSATFERRIPAMMIGGALGTASTFVVTYAAYELSGGGDICGDAACGGPSALVTLFFVEPALTALGVHLGNGRRGDFHATMGASYLIGWGGTALGARLGADRGLILLIPIAQIAASILVESLTGK